MSSDPTGADKILCEKTDCHDKSPKHLNGYLHYCRYGMGCRKTSDPVHKSRFVHVKGKHSSGAGISLMSHQPSFGPSVTTISSTVKDYTLGLCKDADKCKIKETCRWRHPCEQGSKCHQINSISHTERFVHLCPNFDNCNNKDPQHVQRLMHLCKVNGCNDKSKTHKNQYIHRCTGNCHKSRIHFIRHFHPCKDANQCGKSKLSQFHIDFFHNKNCGVQLEKPPFHWLKAVNKMDLKPVSLSWETAARVSVSFEQKDYHVIGWELTDASTKSGKVTIFRYTGKGVFNGYFVCKNVNELTFKYGNNHFDQPWYHHQVRVYKSEAVDKRINSILSKNLYGNVSYKNMLDSIGKRYPVFIVGGAIRDVLYEVANGKNSEINDIDIGFGTSTKELYDHIKAKHPNCKVTYRQNTGLIQIGSGSTQLEGKPLNSLNNDRCPLVGKLPKTTGSDLHKENICRDFTCNSLWYDTVNGVIIDPTGRGVQDAVNKEIMISVPKDMWKNWLKGNPSKLTRYFKFRAKGYKCSDKNVSDFIVTSLKHQLPKSTQPLFLHMLNGLDANTKNEIKRLITECIGKDLYEKYLSIF